MLSELLGFFLEKQNNVQLHLFVQMLLVPDEDNKLSNPTPKLIPCHYWLFLRIILCQ